MASKKTASEALTSPDTMLDRPTPEEIAALAYDRYLQRGGTDGGDLDDWLEAERALVESRMPVRPRRLARASA